MTAGPRKKEDDQPDPTSQTPTQSSAHQRNQIVVALDDESDIEYVGSAVRRPQSADEQAAARAIEQAKLTEVAFVRRVAIAVKAGGTIIEIGNVLSTRRLVLNYA